MSRENISTGLHLFRDGNMWCAVGPAFRNLQEDRAGFGRSPQDALDGWWIANENDAEWRRTMPVKPALADFKLHLPEGMTSVPQALWGDLWNCTLCSRPGDFRYQDSAGRWRHAMRGGLLSPICAVQDDHAGLLVTLSGEMGRALP